MVKIRNKNVHAPHDNSTEAGAKTSCFNKKKNQMKDFI